MVGTSSDDTVTICIPAYQAEGFLAETVESALAQTHRAIRMVIAVDPGNDDTPRIARRYAGSRVTVIVNQQRRGWIGNTNFALSQARSRYAMILPHDDILAPTYVELCLAELKRHPAAVNCYAMLDVIGDPGTIVRRPSLTGSLEQRLVTVLATWFDGLPYRGIIDLAMVRQPSLPAATGNYAADTLWIAKLACQGELVQVPEVLYHKRLLPTSAHAGWSPQSDEELYEMWAVHCLEMVSVIVSTRPELGWNSTLQAAFEHRVRALIGYPRFTLNPALADPSVDISAYVTEVAERVRARPRPYSWVKA